jgi:hypothetical protein
MIVTTSTNVMTAKNLRIQTTVAMSAQSASMSTGYAQQGVVNATERTLTFLQTYLTISYTDKLLAAAGCRQQTSLNHTKQNKS